MASLQGESQEQELRQNFGTLTDVYQAAGAEKPRGARWNQVPFDIYNAAMASLRQGTSQPQSPAYSPTTPPSMSRGDSDEEMDLGSQQPSPSLRIRIPPSQGRGSPMEVDRGTKSEDVDSGRSSPDIVLEDAQNHALTIPIDPNVFLPYQRRVVEAIRQIEQMRPNDLPAAQAADLRRIIQVIYEVFFGVDYRTGEPTEFYQQHGAAPIAGMNPAQLTQQATQARQAQQAVAQNAEDSLGFLRTFLQPLFNRANDPAVAAAFTASWQQQGANTNIAAPLNDITRLMTAVQNIHIAGAHLVRSDPLFIANRSERVQQGDLRVRNWYERVGYWIALNGYASLRNMVSSFGQLGRDLAARLEAIMPAAYRSPHLAIQQFEVALNEYNTIYQHLPPWARLCWTLPYPPDSIEYNQAASRPQNKPGAEELRRAMARAQRGDVQGALQMLIDARDNVLNHPASTYPAFLTLDRDGAVNGPLIAYYYALYGGRMLYEQEGRQWLTDEFNRHPGRFIQEMGTLVDTMEEMHRQQQSSGVRLGEGFLGQNEAWLNAVHALESQDPQMQQQAAARVSGAFGQSQVGTIDRGNNLAYICRPGGGKASSSFCESMRGTFNPQQSTQQGAVPLMGSEVVAESGSGSKGAHEFHAEVAEAREREAGARYAHQQQDLAGEKVTEQFLKALRAHYRTSDVRGDHRWMKDTRRDKGSVENPEESIESPGILDILNTPVQLYAPVPSTTGRPVSPRHKKRWVALPRAQAGVGTGPGLLLWQLLVRNLNGFRNINDPDMLLHRLGQLGTGIVWAARQGTGLNGFQNPAFGMLHGEVRNIALRMLQNPLLRSVIQVHPERPATYTENSVQEAIRVINSKRGGRRKTRKHKKRRKKTRHRRKRGKKTRHKKKKRTRKH